MYVKLDSLEQTTREQMQALFMDPYVGFPPEGEATNDVLQSYGFAILEYDAYPNIAGLETYSPGPLRNDNGRIFQSWIIVVPTAEATTEQFEAETQAMLDASAKAHGYDNINTVVSYADEPAVPKFQNDGVAFRAWRSKVWGYAYEQLALVKSGARTQPTLDDFLAELPALEFPA